jgi:hypothetical protein
MFEAVNGKMQTRHPFTIKIGKNAATCAKYFLPYPQALIDTLALLASNTFSISRV